MTTRTTTNTRFIKASPEVVYKAFTTPEALEEWMAPGDMRAEISHFDLRVGGGYEMTLFYPESDASSVGKSDNNEDRYRATFLQLVPNEIVATAIRFYSDKPEFSGVMTMEVAIAWASHNEGTNVTITFINIPEGISAEDNEKGTELSLDKLARYTEKEHSVG